MRDFKGLIFYYKNRSEELLLLIDNHNGGAADLTFATNNTSGIYLLCCCTYLSSRFSWCIPLLAARMFLSTCFRCILGPLKDWEEDPVTALVGREREPSLPFSIIGAPVNSNHGNTA